MGSCTCRKHARVHLECIQFAFIGSDPPFQTQPAITCEYKAVFLPHLMLLVMEWLSSNDTASFSVHLIHMCGDEVPLFQCKRFLISAHTAYHMIFDKSCVACKTDGWAECAVFSKHAWWQLTLLQG